MIRTDEQRLGLEKENGNMMRSQQHGQMQESDEESWKWKKKNRKGGIWKKWEKTWYSLNTGTELKTPDSSRHLQRTRLCATLWQSRHPTPSWAWSTQDTVYQVLVSVLQHGLTDCQPWDVLSVCLTAFSQRKENLCSQQPWPASAGPAAQQWQDRPRWTQAAVGGRETEKLP